MRGFIYGLPFVRRVIRRLRGEPDLDRFNFGQYTNDLHPERLVLLPYCNGRGIDVGCGARKTTRDCIGVDITPSVAVGDSGCVDGEACAADICASGDALPMFEVASLDFVVARHNIEHYVDVIKTLKEWKRVLRLGGVMAIVIPDDRKIDTIRLDRTHKHAFTPESFGRYVELIGGLEIERLETVIDGWSFVCVCRKCGM